MYRPTIILDKPTPIYPAPISTKQAEQVADGILSMFAPIKVAPVVPRVGKCTVTLLSYTVTIDEINVTLELYDQADNVHHEVFVIYHEQFLQWAEDQNYLSIDGAMHCQHGGTYEHADRSATIGYATYLENYIKDEDIKSYLISAGVSHEWQL